MHSLKAKLQRLNHNKYSLYEALLGEYRFSGFSLRFDDIQPDPFAPPSKATLLIPFDGTKFSPELIGGPLAQISFCDSLARLFAKEGRRLCTEKKGSGNGGLFGIRHGKQKVIEGNSVLIRAGVIEVRILAGLPAFGRNIAAREALEFLCEEIPAVVRAVCAYPSEPLLEAARLLKRQFQLRDLCRREGLIAFVGTNSILPRQGGQDTPLPKAIAFSPPKEWERRFVLDDGFEIRGMGIPRGFTLIAGGGYHGKSTLLSALSAGIYNHILGDGREYCLTAEDAVFLRAEDGRPAAGTDISPFIHDLPGGQSSSFFQSGAASGSTSQALNLMESLEAGSRTFLIDEDVSATNFLVRDELMGRLVSKETITPLASALPHLKKEGVSIILVSGALGGLLGEADRVLLAENYRYIDATAQARKLAGSKKTEASPLFTLGQSRRMDASGISIMGKRERPLVEGGEHSIRLGRDEADLSAWHQLADPSQYGTLAAVLAYAKDRGYLDGSPGEYLRRLSADLERFGWDLFSDVHCPGWRYVAAVRPADIHAALCRLRSLKAVPLP